MAWNKIWAQKTVFQVWKKKRKSLFLFGFVAFIPFMISIEFSFTMWIVYSGNGLWNNNNKALFMLGEILFLPYIPIDFCCNAIRCLFIIQPSRLIELNEIAILGVFLFISLWKKICIAPNIFAVFGGIAINTYRSSIHMHMCDWVLRVCAYG